MPPVTQSRPLPNMQHGPPWPSQPPPPHMLPTPLFTPPPQLSSGGDVDEDVEVLNQNCYSGFKSVMKSGQLQCEQPPLPQMLPTPLCLALPLLPSPPDMFGVLGTF